MINPVSKEINEINSGAIDMQPDNNADYNQILNEMNVSGDVSSQFTNNLQNMNTQTEVDKSVSQIFPNKLKIILFNPRIQALYLIIQFQITNYK